MGQGGDRDAHPVLRGDRSIYRFLPALQPKYHADEFVRLIQADARSGLIIDTSSKVVAEPYLLAVTL